MAKIRASLVAQLATQIVIAGKVTNPDDAASLAVAIIESSQKAVNVQTKAAPVKK
jgi:hypothetical protein